MAWKDFTIHRFVMQVELEFIKIHSSVDHGSAFGRVALSCPATQVLYIHGISVCSVSHLSALILMYV